MRTNKDIWIDGTHARKLGARVLKVSEYQPAQKIRDDHAIPGRDAFVSIWDGAYDAVTVTVRYEFADFLQIAKLTDIKKLGVGKHTQTLGGETVVIDGAAHSLAEHAEGAVLEYDVIKTEAEQFEYVRGGWHVVDVTYTCEPRKHLVGKTVELAPDGGTEGGLKINSINPFPTNAEVQLFLISGGNGCAVHLTHWDESSQDFLVEDMTINWRLALGQGRAALIDTGKKSVLDGVTVANKFDSNKKLAADKVLEAPSDYPIITPKSSITITTNGVQSAIFRWVGEVT